MPRSCCEIRKWLCKMSGYQLLLLLFMMVEVECVAPHGSVKCETSASALEKPANVTCFFNGNLSVSDAEIMVVHRPFGAAKSDIGKDVLICIGSENQEKPKCIARDGYTFDGNQSDRLTLMIPSATEKCLGQYACHVIPSDGIAVSSCDLSLPDNPITPPETTTSSKGSADVNDADHLPCRDAENNYTALISALVVVTMLLCVSITVIVVFLKRNHLTKHRSGEEGDDQQSAEPLLLTRDGQPQSSLFQTLCGCFGSLIAAKRTNKDAIDRETQIYLDKLSRPDEKRRSKSLSKEKTGNAFEMSGLRERKRGSSPK